ncbi:hypothetical protein Tco_0201214 [Tanacetum coccineum]
MCGLGVKSSRGQLGYAWINGLYIFDLDVKDVLDAPVRVSQNPIYKVMSVMEMEYEEQEVRYMVTNERGYEKRNPNSCWVLLIYIWASRRLVLLCILMLPVCAKGCYYCFELILVLSRLRKKKDSVVRDIKIDRVGVVKELKYVDKRYWKKSEKDGKLEEAGKSFNGLIY